MAVPSHSLLVRVFFIISLVFNVVFISRSFTGRTALPNHAHRFHHRAVAVQDAVDEGTNSVRRSNEQPSAPQQLAPEIDSQGDSQGDPPPKFAATNADQTRLVSQSASTQTRQYSQVGRIELDDDSWTVLEDVSQRNGDIVFESTKTKERRVFPKTGEATFEETDAKFPKFAGLQLADIGLAAEDLLATRILKDGEPDERGVRLTIPLTASAPPEEGYEPGWTSFLGTVEASDTAPIFTWGGSRTYFQGQDSPDLLAYRQSRFEGKVGGFMPAIRKIFTKAAEDDPTDYFELISFADVDAKDPFIVQTWHRTTHINNNSIVGVVFGHSYPTFPKSKPHTTAKEFYRALFRFGDYWNARLSDMAPVALPDPSWENMAKFALVTELMARPGGDYPKYGAVDRDYAGSEYDGFQDIFTSSLSANLEWGRFAQARSVIDNYLSLFVSSDGSINMRGPEVGQFGLMLSMLAKYLRYSGEPDILFKHKEKIVALAKVLTGLHDESLMLNPSQPGYGLLHGWSESDSALKKNLYTYWQPFYSNTALAIRGFRDISALTIFSQHAPDWTKRAEKLTARLTESITASITTRAPGTPQNATALPYVPPLPDTNQTFRESMATLLDYSPQNWPHRLYTELLHPAVLPLNISNKVIDTMRNFGATSMGVVANVGAPYSTGRDILGFISYGYAYALLINDRIDEFVLFLYTHRYHVHTRGAWKAGEVTSINRGDHTFCVPAQLTIPSILRWALVLEHPDEETLYLGRGIPRAWLATGKEIRILQAPTRWGKVDFSIQVAGASVNLGAGVKVRARVTFGKGSPEIVEFKFRLPKGVGALTKVLVNGREMGMKGDEENVVVVLKGKESPVVVEGF
ncbi:Tat pathway signal protein [Venturia nashicola]|nr:Tat pathway signal protein [Venturia nashicola]